MGKPVSCEAIGGPLDGWRIGVQMKVCGCCGEEFFQLDLGQSVTTLQDLIWLSRQRLNSYVPDLVLRRLTWSP